MAENTFEFRIGDLVLYKNNQLIAFNKPAGIPVQQDKTGDKSLLDLAEIYCRCKLNLIHRLDRPATGVVLLAKTHGALVDLNEQFKNHTIKKTYLAVVKEPPPATEGTLVHYLRKTGQTRAVAADTETPGYKRAELQYRWLGKSDQYQLLSVQLISGRFHQVRAQLAAIGCPIKGDVKYGARRSNPDRSIHLHAWKLGFIHPISGVQEEIVAPVPKGPVWDAFETLLR